MTSSKLTTVDLEHEIREFLLVVKGYFLRVVMGAKIVVGVNIVGLYLNNHLPFLEGYFFRPGRGGYAVGVHVMVLVDRQWLPGKARSPKSKLCPVGL